MLDIPVTVVVPETTSVIALQLLKKSGAEIIVFGQSWNEANTLAQSLMCDLDAFIHPFDDPLLWRGHASLITEVVDSGFIPDAVVLAVGGGGLLCGVVEGLARVGLGKTPIFAAETTGAASLAAAAQAGQLVMLPEITSVASSLGAKQVCQRALDLCLAHAVHCIQLTDLDALSACRQFLTDHQVLVEPACGAALAVAYERPQVLQNFQQVLMIACGGVTASVSSIEAAYLREVNIMRAGGSKKA
jgi:L-serine/L-threonine ammonia-lyase